MASGRWARGPGLSISPPAETAVPPAGHLPGWSGPAAGWTILQTMNIDAAGMDGPGLRFFLRPRAAGRGGIALLQPQIPCRETSTPQGTEQLVTVVAKRLEPGPRRCPHREQSALQPQRAAVGGQLGPGDARPCLPQGRQMSFPLPLDPQTVQAGTDRAGTGPGWGDQHRQVADPAGLQARWSRRAGSSRRRFLLTRTALATRWPAHGATLGRTRGVDQRGEPRFGAWARRVGAAIRWPGD